MEQTHGQSEQLRQGMLKTAFEGRLVHQDPTDETAGDLLERIGKAKEKPIFKDPVTDDGTKKSLVGRVSVHKDKDGRIYCLDSTSTEKTAVDENLLRTIFIDGELKVDVTLEDIRLLKK